MMRNDHLVQGPKLFTKHCASCHSHADATGDGIVCKEPTAPNLFGFASREWLKGLLDPKQIAGPHYFGKTKHKEGAMAGFVKDDFKPEAGQLEQVVAALSAEAQLPSQVQLDRDETTSIAAGKKLIESLTCTDCHKYHNIDNEGGAPDLTGYGNRAWLTDFISDPAHVRFYGENNDNMPSFFKDKTNPQNNKLTARELEMIVSWLRGEK